MRVIRVYVLACACMLHVAGCAEDKHRFGKLDHRAGAKQGESHGRRLGTTGRRVLEIGESGPGGLKLILYYMAAV